MSLSPFLDLKQPVVLCERCKQKIDITTSFPTITVFKTRHVKNGTIKEDWADEEQWCYCSQKCLVSFYAHRFGRPCPSRITEVFYTLHSFHSEYDSKS